MARRPGSYTTFAVLNFVIGGILLLCSVCSGIHPTVTINNQDATQRLIDFMNQNVPGYTVMKVGGTAVGFLLAGGLIAGGIGLLQNHSWGRIMTMIVVLFSAIHHLGMTIFQIVWVNPALDRFFAGFPLFNLSILPKSLAMGFIIFWSLAVIYYVVQVIVLAITPPGVGDDHDDDDERPRRRHDRDEDDDLDDDRPRRRRSRHDDDDDERPRRR